MKKLLTPLLLLISGVMLAQMPKETVDTKAKGILDELSKKTKSYSTIKAEFSIQTLASDNKVKDNTTGSLNLKGNKYKLELKGQTIFCDAKNQWTYIKESNEVQINNAPDPDKTDNVNPVNIFSLYEKGYKYKYEKEEKLNGKQVHVINLYPLDPGKKNFHTVKLYIDKVKLEVLQVKILNKDASFTLISLKNFITNTDMPDAFFVFNKADYKGVEIVDLRE